MNSKLWLLLRVLGRDPVEFYDRVKAVLEVKLEDRRTGPSALSTRSVADVCDSLGRLFGAKVDLILREEALRELQARLSSDVARLNCGPFGLFHNGDFALGRMCYVACRVAQPSIVLETGVAYGVTSAFLLQALHMNRKGKLFSIDLPPLGRNGNAYIGALIPQELRTRWRLFPGSSRRVLPKLLASLGQTDMFVHDSLHTYANMKREFDLVWSHLRRSGVLIADDVEGNRAFEEFSGTARPVLSAVLAEERKSSFFGLAVKQ